MLRYSEDEGRALACNVIQIFAAYCGKEFIEVFLNVFEDEREVLQSGLKSFLSQIAVELGAQDKQTVCKNFFNFCRLRAESFWLVEFWLSHQSIGSFSLQNEESLDVVLNMFFDFYCDLARDIVCMVRKSRAQSGLPPGTVTLAEVEFYLHKLDAFWELLERPESDQVIQDIHKNSISLLALKMKIRNARIFRIEQEWVDRLSHAREHIERASAGPGRVDPQEALSTRERELKSVLLSKRVFKRFGLVAEFADKLALFLDVDGTRLENSEKLFAKMEKYLISHQNAFFLTLPAVLLQSVRRQILANRFRLSLKPQKIMSVDSDVVETLFSLVQNFSFLNEPFAELGLTLIFLPHRSEPMFLDPRVYEIVCWVFEIQLRRVNLAEADSRGLTGLLRVTDLLGRILRKADQKHFLSKIFELLLHLLVDSADEARTLKSAKFKDRVTNLPSDAQLGTFGNFYDKNIIFGERNFLRAGNFAEIESQIKSRSDARANPRQNAQLSAAVEDHPHPQLARGKPGQRAQAPRHQPGLRDLDDAQQSLALEGGPAALPAARAGHAARGAVAAVSNGPHRLPESGLPDARVLQKGHPLRQEPRHHRERLVLRLLDRPRQALSPGTGPFSAESQLERLRVRGQVLQSVCAVQGPHRRRFP